MTLRSFTQALIPNNITWRIQCRQITNVYHSASHCEFLILAGKLNDYVKKDCRLGYINNSTLKFSKVSRSDLIHWIVFIAIIGLGIFARTWEFNSLPPGLNSDEASNGVDALSIDRFGIDRNGVSYPIKFVSWGGGQDALYGYILVPFVALLGLTPAVVRLPMLVSGILSLPLLYYVARKTNGKAFALLSMFLLAISPWHILLSRWGLEANLFPFVFLAGYECLLNYKQSNGWIISACALFGLCLYAYGTAYAMVPIFMVSTIIVLAQEKYLSGKNLLAGVLAFIFVAAPIGMLILVNTFNMNSIKLGPMIIPHFPVQARYVTETVLSSAHPIQTVLSNLSVALTLIFTQSDGLIYNVVNPYGYIYTITFPLILMGLVLLFIGLMKDGHLEYKLLLIWIGASIAIALIQPVDINRLNIIFIPLILCLAFSIHWMSDRYKAILPVTVSAFLIGFIFFTITYHGVQYRQQAGLIFHNGLLPAINFSRQIKDTPICIDDNNMPYIFVLFSEKADPASYLNEIKYVDPQAPIRSVLSFGRYTFGRHNCTNLTMPIYILIAGKTPPPLGNKYKVKFFNDYAVYFPAH
jgi:hypothetical protein